MEDDCLSLKWNNHAATYREMLNYLRLRNTLTDVTLACDGETFSAHKLVLVTCSDYFHSILKDLQCSHPIIYLRGVNKREIEALIDFMYMGQTDIPQREVPDLLATAEALQIKGLGVYNAPVGGDILSEALTSTKSIQAVRKRQFSSHSKSSKSESAKENVDFEVPSNSTLPEDDSFHFSNSSSPKRQRKESSISTKASDVSASPLTASMFENVSIQDKCLSYELPNELPNNLSHIPTSIASTSSNRIFHYKHTSPLVPFQGASSHQLKEPSINGNRSPSSLHGKDSYQKHKYSSLDNFNDHSRSSTNITSPRVNQLRNSQLLNYSLVSHGDGREDITAGALSRFLDEANLSLADSPDNLIKTEIKDEALDFTNAATNVTDIPSPVEPVRSTASVSGSANPYATNIPEETKMYLDAFARSANLTRPLVHDENVDISAAVDRDRPYSCPMCHKRFAKAAILKRHHLAHFRPYVCHICNRSFTRREVLAEHLLEHNGADLRLPCPVCDMTIKRKRNLQAHIKAKHPEYYQQKLAKREALC